MGIEKLPENSQVKLNQIMSDGKVSGEEVKGLTAAEQEALSGILGGKLPDVGEEVSLKGKKQAEEQQPKKKERSLAETLGIGAAAVAGGAVVGGLIGAAVGFLGGGVGAVPGAVAGAKIGAAATALLFGLSSCSPQEDDIFIEGDKPTVNTNVQITATISVDQLANILQDQFGSKLDNIVTLLAAIQADTNVMKAGMEKIFMALTELGVKVDQLYENMDLKGDVIIQLLVENNTKQDEILNAMSKNHAEVKAQLETILNAVRAGNKIGENNGKVLNEILAQLKTLDNYDDTDVKNLLNALLNKVTQGVEENKDMNTKTQQLLSAILAAISKMDADMRAGITAIIGRIDTLSNANVELLTNILNKIENMPSGQDYSKILNAIYDKLQESVDSNKEMNAETHKILNDILNNMQNFNGDLKTAVEKILAKLDSMSSQNKTFFEAVLAKLDGLSDGAQSGIADILAAITEGNTINKTSLERLTAILNKLDSMDASQKAFFDMALEKYTQLEETTKANTDKLLEAIKENTAVAKGTYCVATEILNNLNKLGDKADSILDAITNISIGDVKVDLSTIEKMLADILAQSKANGDVLTSIDSKLNFVALTLEGIKNQIGEGNEKLLAKLDEILKKIPDGCHCTTLDLTVIIEKLDQIIEVIQKDPNGNHEGILDDLDDLLG